MSRRVARRPVTELDKSSFHDGNACVFVIVEESWRREILTAQLAAIRFPAKFFTGVDAFCAGIDESRHGCLIYDVHSAVGAKEVPVRMNSLPAPPLIYITADVDAAVVVQLMKSGAVDYLPRPTYDEADLLNAVRRALDVDVERRIAAADSQARRARFESLTHADRQVLRRLLLGYSNAGVAAALNITEAAAEARRVRLMKKMGVKNFPALLRYAFESGFDAELQNAAESDGDRS